MLSSILLMTPTEGSGSGYQSLIFLGLIMVVFYFFFIRPQAKKAKDLKKYREALKKGDKIITIGGIHGKIVEVQEATFTIEVEDGSRLRVERSAVAGDASDQLGNQQK
ncbi:MAG: preprotein translocase subunit YajC [Bacteroidetes bacterium HGW-Bacteroidetes-9]|jgi:preprotein translocase subunit YajC|nr:MAG: preprotein translocase subunit YajC [Bacteroidetes bacterium HGW-Bacteroidetes-9]